MVKPKDIRSQQFSPSDKIVFDTNIWMYLNGPQGDPLDARSKVYSAALKRMIEANCKPIVDALIISEFINAYTRFEFNLTAQQLVSFKTYRRSHAFKSVATAIACEARSILSLAKRVDSGFSQIDVATMLNTFSSGDHDFNDLLLADVCRTNHCILVTDDADFKIVDLPILTANGKLLGLF